MLPRFYRFSYVINGYGVRRGTRESPTYFSIVGCVYGYWGVQWRREVIEAKVRELYEEFQDDYRLIIHVHRKKALPRYEGEELVEVPSHESVGLGFYRGYSQTEFRGKVVDKQKSDLRFRPFRWFPAVVGFECPSPV